MYENLISLYNNYSKLRKGKSLLLRQCEEADADLGFVDDTTVSFKKEPWESIGQTVSCNSFSLKRLQDSY